MHPTRSAPARLPRWPLIAVAIAVALVCAFALWRPWHASPPRPIAAGPEAAALPAAPLALPTAGGRVLVFGDSWTYGSAASLPTLGYAYILGRDSGWDITVAGVRGSGYLKAGIDGGSYGERIAQLDPALDPELVIVQGSINDRRLPSAGYREAVTAAWDALAARYPGASFVILGPAPQVLPVQPETARIDRDLADLAAARGWSYISPLAEDWIAAENYAMVIDSGIGRDHPSTNGHAYLAERLRDALVRLSAPTDIVADAERETEPEPEPAAP